METSDLKTALSLDKSTRNNAQDREKDDQANSISFTKLSVPKIRQRPSILSLGGRDGGGTQSGAGSEDEGSDEGGSLFMGKPAKKAWPTNGAGDMQPRSLARALKGDFGIEDVAGRAMADALGDQSDASVEETDVDGDKEREKVELESIVEAERRDRSIKGSVY